MAARSERVRYGYHRIDMAVGVRAVGPARRKTSIPGHSGSPTGLVAGPGSLTVGGLALQGGATALMQITGTAPDKDDDGILSTGTVDHDS